LEMVLRRAVVLKAIKSNRKPPNQAVAFE
jgi:hypothetical protein